jgi:hypothetical protein
MVLGYVVGGLAVYSSIWSPKAVQMDAVLNQASYAAVSRDLMCQLALSRRDRPDAREYIHAKLAELERLKAAAPPVSRAARRAYERKFRDNPIYSAEDQWGVASTAALAAARASRRDLSDSETRERDTSRFSDRKSDSPQPSTDSSEASSGETQWPSLAALDAMVDARAEHGA